MKSAPLDLILKANGKKTGEELIAERLAKEKAARDALMDKTGYFMNARQRRSLRKTLEKAGTAP